MNIVILDDYQDAVRKLACANKLDKFNAKIYTNHIKGTSQLVFRIKDADVLILNHGRTQITRAVLEKLPKLKLIIQIGLIGPHLDLNACTQHGIAVIEGQNPVEGAAEFTWALIMSATRRLPQYISMLKHGGWQQSGLKRASMPNNFGLATRLAGKTMGIWGFGKVGSIVAQYAQAFKMNILVWGSQESCDKAAKAGYQVAHNKDTLFQQSDVLSVHLRLSNDTFHIIKMRDLQQMKPTSLFVNTAHAELVETDALVAALNRGTPGIAAIDVFDSEPILQGHALLRLENAICSPHIGCIDQETFEQHFCIAFEHIAQFAQKQEKMLPIVNPEVLQHR